MSKSAALMLTLLLTPMTLLAEKTLTLELYNDKGLMGKHITTITDPLNLSAKTELSWNNRRVSLDESYRLNRQGFPIEVKVSGVSAFGAPVSESFHLLDGVAKWQSRADQGEQRLKDSKYYLTVDGFNQDALVRLLLKSPFNQVELLPSGKVQLRELQRIQVSKQDKTQDVVLYAIEGLNFNPDFIWTDNEGYRFALGDGWIKGIRKGWDLETFAQLDAISKKAEHEYYQQLTAEITQPLNGSLLLQKVRIVDVEAKQVLPAQDLLIEAGKIKAIGESLTVDPATRTMNAEGKYLIPGLWDMHGHLSKTDGFNYLANGVTSVRDIGNSPENMEEVERLFAGDFIGTRIYKAGFIDKQSDYSGGIGFTVNSIEEAKEAVDWYAERGYIQIKTYSSMDPKWVPELAKHIHGKGMRLSGHIPAFMSAEQAVDAGFDEIQHVNMLFLNFLGGDQIDTRQQLRFSLIGDKAASLDLDSPEVSRFVKKLADQNIEVDLTVSTFRSLLLTRDRMLDGEYADIADHLPPLFQRGLKTATMKIETPEQDASYQAAGEALLKMTKKLFDQGVPIIPGTDAFTGFTLLRELELYAKAGIPAIDVIRIGSLESARVVGKDQQTGSIAVGKDADLVLLNADPTENIQALRQAVLVIQGDKAYSPEKLFKAIGVKPFVPGLTLP